MNRSSSFEENRRIDSMIGELSHIKNNTYKQELWDNHNNTTNSMLERLEKYSRRRDTKENAVSVLTDHNPLRQDAEDFMIQNASYRNKTLKLLERK
jgi:hypothetical protein